MCLGCSCLLLSISPDLISTLLERMEMQPNGECSGSWQYWEQWQDLGAMVLKGVYSGRGLSPGLSPTLLVPHFRFTLLFDSKLKMHLG